MGRYGGDIGELQVLHVRLERVEGRVRVRVPVRVTLRVRARVRVRVG